MFINNDYKLRYDTERGGQVSDSSLYSSLRVNRTFLLRVSSIAALGGVLYGYDMGIIAAAAIFVKSSFALSTFMEELVVSTGRP